MVCGPICIECDARSALVCTYVGGDELALGKDLDHACADAHLQALADMLVWNRVVRVLDLDVIVRMHACQLPLRILVRPWRQRFECGLVECVFRTKLTTDSV